MPQANNCGCQVGSYWNNNYCMACSSTQTWDYQRLLCVCPAGLNWNGVSCVSCAGGQIWNTNSMVCGCPDRTIWNGYSCIPVCTGGQVYNIQTRQCSCGSDQNWNGYICVSCVNGQVWNPVLKNCACPNGLNWNSYSCVSCPSGQSWDGYKCGCSNGMNWDGFKCIQCTGGRVWNQKNICCECPNTGTYWNGNSCISCSANQYWNGYMCLSCVGNQIWNSLTLVCACPANQQWNGTSCLVPCFGGKVYENGICRCPTGTFEINGGCQNAPNCPSGSFFNGSSCASISCPPGSFWDGSKCSTYSVDCPYGTYYNGMSCVTNISACPFGTEWNGFLCQTTNTQCSSGSYFDGSACISLPQLCPYPTFWDGSHCAIKNNACPDNCRFTNGICEPINPCPNGQVWNKVNYQCECPNNCFWNGGKCIECPSGQIYTPGFGCICSSGSFFDGTKCTTLPSNQCQTIGNALWSGTSCSCSSGFINYGMECTCTGLIYGNSCSRCASKPHSTFKNGICQCDNGYVDVKGTCIVSKPNPKPVPSNSCSIATFFDSQQKSCLTCPDGCLSCYDSYTCLQCKPEYYTDCDTTLCLEICGDGKRFSLACDDGNNVNGDGCSSDCRVEIGYTCYGGSPNSRDICTMARPTSIQIVNGGQTHTYGKMIVNVVLNFLPKELIESQTDCRNKCSSVLKAEIVTGDSSSTSITASYVATTSFIFSIEIAFGREPIGKFQLRVGLNPSLAIRYFSGIDISKTVVIDVNPALMALYRENKDDDILK